MLYVFFKALKSILKPCYIKHCDVAAAKVSEHLPKGVINLLFDTDGFLILYAYKAILDGAFPVMLSDHFQKPIILFTMKV